MADYVHIVEHDVKCFNIKKESAGHIKAVKEEFSRCVSEEPPILEDKLTFDFSEKQPIFKNNLFIKQEPEIIETEDVKSSIDGDNRQTKSKSNCFYNPPDIFSCEQQNSESSATHLKIHTGNKPYTCEICRKSFSKTRDLKTHVRTHTGEKPFPCTICAKLFSQKSHVRTHMKVHSGEKPFFCDVCRKNFSGSSDLARHAKIHTGIKPYNCDVCHKNFSENGSLQRHVKVHMGEKPFTCEVCVKNFSRSEHLKRHMRVHIT